MSIVDAVLAHQDGLKIISIPFVAAFVGWSTNWLAVRMTFYPLDFWGVHIGPLPLGWQGIIPSKARRMAGLAVQSILSKLISMREIVEVMDPRLVAEHIIEEVDPLLDAWTDEMMIAHHPVLWSNLPDPLRRMMRVRVRAKLPHLIDDLMQDIALNVDHLVDVKTLVEDHLEKNKELLNRVFWECGQTEFRFLVHSGWFFGGFFGLLQMLQWFLFPVWWTLPIGGVVVGYATNWIALNLIFRPLNPIRIGPLRIQGLFLKRQDAVSESFCRIMVEDIVTLRRLIESMLQGPQSERTAAIVRRHMRPLVDGVAGALSGTMKLLVQTTLGPSRFAEIRESVGDKALAEASLPFNNDAFAHERAAVVGKLIQGRMQQLPAEEFQDLLRPCFKEDEMKLILVGAALGCMAGFAQLFLVFGFG
ncbi:MAG: hypothetical protein VX836_14430 [Pseudomonadota bacterium]|nr:hypothetical protein [Pseudomonadota bacterium]